MREYVNDDAKKETSREWDECCRTDKNSDKTLCVGWHLLAPAVRILCTFICSPVTQDTNTECATAKTVELHFIVADIKCRYKM